VYTEDGKSEKVNAKERKEKKLKAHHNTNYNLETNIN
jgi:hypothetical protein